METWNGQFEAEPTNSDIIGAGNEAIQLTREAVRERIAIEHEMDLTEGAPQPRHGLHKAGSARVFYASAAPTTLPNGTALGALDVGRLWVNSSTGVLKQYTGPVTGWADLAVAAVASGSGSIYIPAIPATNGTVVLRDSGGKSEINTPTTANEIANKSYVDTKAALDVATHNNVSAVHNATAEATADRIILRDAAGRARVAAPSGATDIARLDTVTAYVAAPNADLAAATAVATAGQLIRRDAQGRASVEYPVSQTDIATKKVVDDEGTVRLAADISLQNNLNAHASAQTAENGIGSYMFALNNSGGTLNYGSTVAGTDLLPSGVSGNQGTFPVTGTWKCMGYAPAGSSTLFARIS